MAAIIPQLNLITYKSLGVVSDPYLEVSQAKARLITRIITRQTMAFPTQPAFVHYGTWDDESRKHPAMKWMYAPHPCTHLKPCNLTITPIGRPTPTPSTVRIGIPN